MTSETTMCFTNEKGESAIYKFEVGNPIKIRHRACTQSELVRFYDERYLPMKCLLVRSEWAKGIMSGAKTAEIRGNTRYPLNEWVGIVETGTNMCYGMVMFSHSVKIDNETEWGIFRKEHKVANTFSEIPYEKVYAWCISSVVRFTRPVKIIRKKGQVVWVKNPLVESDYPVWSKTITDKKFWQDCVSWEKEEHFFKP